MGGILSERASRPLISEKSPEDLGPLIRYDIGARALANCLPLIL